ncbi:MAG: tetratricopeptide repeat protein [Deltaproteobacteria bacterium]|nr:tetratricopeptide repeat protein [Deltaproteobacteria bacterium]
MVYLFKISIAPLLIILLFSMISYQRNAIWNDDHILWTDTRSKSPQKARVYNNLGLIYLDQEHYEKATLALKTALEKSIALQIKTSPELMIEDSTEKDSASLPMLKYAPHSAEIYNNLGTICLRQGKWNQAITYYEKALTLKSTYPNPFNNLGFIYNQKGQPDKAIEALKEALRLKPSYPEAYNNLGVAYKEKRLYQHAIESYKKAITLRPDYLRAHFSLAFIYRGTWGYLRKQ